MNYRLEKSAGLKQSQLSQIAWLEDTCNRFEGLAMKLNWSILHFRPPQQINDFFCYDGEVVVGYLAIYAFGGPQAEISAMTHPNYRQQGIFKQLLAAAGSELEQRNIPDFLFICEQKSASAKYTIQAIEATYEVSEYKMALTQTIVGKSKSHPRLRLRRAQPTDIKAIAVMNHLCFGVPDHSTDVDSADTFFNPADEVWLAEVEQQIIGKIHIVHDESEIIIAGFCIYPQQRNKGFGTAILTQIVEQLTNEGRKNIVLEVSATTGSALSLYRRCGFEVVTAYDYYRLPVSRNEKL